MPISVFSRGLGLQAPPPKFLDPLGYPDPLVVLMGLLSQLKDFTHLPVSPCLHSPLSESVFSCLLPPAHQLPATLHQFPLSLSLRMIPARTAGDFLMFPARAADEDSLLSSSIPTPLLPYAL